VKTKPTNQSWMVGRIAFLLVVAVLAIAGLFMSATARAQLATWEIEVTNNSGDEVGGIDLTFDNTGGLLSDPRLVSPVPGSIEVSGGNTIVAKWTSLLPPGGKFHAQVNLGYMPHFNNGNWTLLGVDVGQVTGGNGGGNGGDINVVAVPTTRLSLGTAPFTIPEPAFHHSFVRNGLFRGGVTRAIVARDFEYSAAVAAQMASGTNFTIVDVVMQQCFGGGFLNDIARDVTGPHTFASSTLWSEVSWSLGKGANPFYLDEFSRAWRQDASDNFGAGMLQHYTAGAVGFNNPPPTPDNFTKRNYPVVKPFASRKSGIGAILPFLLGAQLETPQYQSAGGVFNDQRELGVNSTGSTHQFAILVSWDVGLDIDGAGLARIYRTLLFSGVPAANIAVLGPFDAGFVPSRDRFGARLGTINAPIGPFGPVGPTDGGGLTTSPGIAGDNSAGSWATALAGGYFGTRPQPGDQLFIFNCGHGNHLLRLPFLGEYFKLPSSNVGKSICNWVCPRVDTNKLSYFEASTVPGETTGDDTNDTVRLYFDSSLLDTLPSDTLANALVTINGYVVTLIPDTDPLPLDPEVYTAGTSPYLVSVPHSIWAGYSDIAVAMDNMPTNIPGDFLVAVDLDGGAQEYLVVNTASTNLWIGGGPVDTNQLTLAVPPVRLTSIPPDATAPSVQTVVWPTIANAVAVQVTRDLNPPIIWQTLTNPIQNFGGVVSFIVDSNTNNSATNSFYRLIGNGP
jgi:hypothetical protein